jgi:ribosomal protein S18 acetylase RimI-like enzyme
MVPPEPAAIDRDRTLPVLVPLYELENEALDSLYINTLATEVAAQGRGVGTAFLELAGELAEGKPLSLVCSDANSGAKKLYERVGFRVKATRPMVKGDWDGEGENWLLMIKRVS